MAMTLPVVTSELRKKYPHHTDGAIEGIQLMKSLTDAQLHKLTSKRSNKVFAEVLGLMGVSTNHSWIRGRAAEELYMRGSIGEELFDELSDR